MVVREFGEYGQLGNWGRFIIAEIYQRDKGKGTKGSGLGPKLGKT